MTRAEIAKKNFLEGYNCAQAVLLAFSDLIDAPECVLKAAALPLGGGLGRLRETCGAVSGGAVCLGLLFPDKSKGEMYALVQELALRFKEKNGSYRCGELLSGSHVQASTDPNPEARTPQYYKKRPCPDLVADAADIVWQIYLEQTKEA